MNIEHFVSVVKGRSWLCSKADTQHFTQEALDLYCATHELTDDVSADLQNTADVLLDLRAMNRSRLERGIKAKNLFQYIAPESLRPKMHKRFHYIGGAIGYLVPWFDLKEEAFADLADRSGFANVPLAYSTHGFHALGESLFVAMNKDHAMRDTAITGLTPEQRHALAYQHNLAHVLHNALSFDNFPFPAELSAQLYSGEISDQIALTRAFDGDAHGFAQEESRARVELSSGYALRAAQGRCDSIYRYEHNFDLASRAAKIHARIDWSQLGELNRIFSWRELSFVVSAQPITQISSVISALRDYQFDVMP